MHYEYNYDHQKKNGLPSGRGGIETHDGRRCDRFGKNGSSGRGAGNKKSGWTLSGETGEEKRFFQTANKKNTGWSG